MRPRVPAGRGGPRRRGARGDVVSARSWPLRRVLRRPCLLLPPRDCVLPAARRSARDGRLLRSSRVTVRAGTLHRRMSGVVSRRRIEMEEVVAERGMVVAKEAPAALAGLAVLEAGGNAVDAAVTAAFATGVLLPLATG